MNSLKQWIIDIKWIFYTIKEKLPFSKTKSAFGQYVPKEVIEEIMAKQYVPDQTPLFEGVGTVIICELSNFSEISDFIENPHDLVQYINPFSFHITEITLKYEGFIYQQEGDCLKIFWPLPIFTKNANHAHILFQSKCSEFKKL